MSPPPPDAPVRLRLKCPDAEDFVQRFAPNVTRGGIFLPTQEARVVGAAIRFEIALVDDSVVFAGEGEVTWVKPKGMGVKFTTLDPATAPMLERLLARREASGPAAPAPAPTPALFAPAPARLPPPAPPPKSPAGAPTNPVPPPPAPPRKSTPAAQVSLRPMPPPSAPLPPRSAPLPPPSRKSTPAQQISLPPLPPPSRKSISASEQASPAPPALQTGLPPIAVPAPNPVPVTDSGPAAPTTEISLAPVTPSARRPLVRMAVAGSAVVAGIAIVWLSTRARPAPAPAAPPVAEPAAPPAAAPAAPPAAAPAVAIAPPPPAAAPEPPPAATPPSPAEPPPAPAAPPDSPPSADPRGLRVENLLVGPTYREHTCPNPSSRLSVRSTRTVNLCMEVAHKPGRTDRLTLVWDRNGEFTSTTHVTIPASTPSHRTRAHMKITKNRIGPWTVRVLSARNAPLAETTFEVVR